MIAQVIINSNVKNLNKMFDYLIPTDIEKNISVGSRVLVPFGNSKTLQEGFIIGLKQESNFKLKEIAGISNETKLEEKEIELAKIMSHRYFCNISDCIKLMLPPGTTTRNFNNRVNDKTERFVYLQKDADKG